MTQKLEWWIILMVDCVTRFLLYSPPLHFFVPMRLQNIEAVMITGLIMIILRLFYCNRSCWYCYKNKAHEISGSFKLDYIVKNETRNNSPLK